MRRAGIKRHIDHGRRRDFGEHRMTERQLDGQRLARADIDDDIGIVSQKMHVQNNTTQRPGISTGSPQFQSLGAQEQ